MRALVFLLVVVNLLFLAWTQGYFGQGGNPDAVRLTQQLQAENLRIVARGEAPGAEAREEKAAENKAVENKAAEKKTTEKNADGCLAWPGLGGADADRLGKLFSEKFPALKTVRRQASDAATWWVFIPAQANKQDAERKAAELKRLAVPEYFIVQEAGPNRYAISLGIFSSEEAANERLAELRAKGVKSARADVRTLKPAPAALEARGGETLLDAARAAAAQLLPESKPTPCGAAA